MPDEKPKRGFASLSPEQRREIASKGGKAAHAKGTAHQWTPFEASLAGQKGGKSWRRAYTRRSKWEMEQ